MISTKASNLEQSYDIYQAEHWSNKAKNSFVNNFKFANYFF